MSGKESRLWQVLDRGNTADLVKMTRIETGLTASGVSDISYVSRRWSGWVELKTSRSWKPTVAVCLLHPFSMSQLTWLASYHDPSRCLRSWLLIGFMRAATFTEFMLLPPMAAAKLIPGRPVVGHEELALVPGVKQFFTARDAVRMIASGE